MTKPIPPLLCAVALLAAAGTPPARAVEASTDPLAALRNGIQPGCAVARLGADGPVFDAAGLADIDSATPITPRTRFLIASASKQVTALAVLTLVDKGQVELDAPAAR